MHEQPIAVTVLTGFLGAGKTTLLNALLRDPELENTAVIINEFGDVSIDHLLVEKANDDVIELADGCLCCSVRGELVDTLADLIERVQTGRIARLDRIVVETTGLADPVPVLQSLIAHSVLAHELRLDGVVTIIDALNGDATLDRHEEAVRQCAVADRLVITKTDLSDAGTRGALTARLQGINPSAQILEAQPGSIPSHAVLFQAGLWDPSTKSADVARWLGEQAAHDHRHDHHHGHDHEHHHHGEDYEGHHHTHDGRVKSFALHHDRPLSWTTVEMFLDLLRSTQGANLLRMKAVVEVEEDFDRPLVLHGVQGMLYPPAWLPAWPTNIDRGTRIVLIGIDLDEDYVRRLFNGFANRPGVDTPDRHAMQNNPLAVSGFSPSS